MCFGANVENRRNEGQNLQMVKLTKIDKLAKINKWAKIDKWPNGLKSTNALKSTNGQNGQMCQIRAEMEKLQSGQMGQNR